MATDNKLIVYLNVRPCHHMGNTCSSVHQLRLCVHPLSKRCKLESDDRRTNKLTAGRKKTHIQSWAAARHAGINESLGRQLSFQSNCGKEYSS